jgi:Bacterial PH domain
MSSSEREWSPAAGLVACAWVGAVAATGWLVAAVSEGSDPAGVLLAGVAAIGLLLAAVYGSRARPRLRVDTGGVTVGGLLRSRHYPWPLVLHVRVLPVRRLGRRTSLLELDTVTASGDERLLVFGRLDLAADPEDVAPQVLALRPTTRP